MSNIYTKVTNTKIIKFEDVSQIAENFNYEGNNIDKPLTYSGATAWAAINKIGVYFNGYTWGRSDEFDSNELTLILSDEQLAEFLEEHADAEVDSIISIDFKNATMHTDSKKDTDYLNIVKEELLRVAKPQIKIIDIKDKTINNLKKNDDFINELKNKLDNCVYNYTIDVSNYYTKRLAMLDNGEYISNNIEITSFEPTIIDSSLNVINTDKSQLFYYSFKLKYNEDEIPAIIKNHFKELLPVSPEQTLLVLDYDESKFETNDEQLQSMALSKLNYDKDSNLKTLINQVRNSISELLKSKIDQLLDIKEREFIKYIIDKIDPHISNYEITSDKAYLSDNSFEQSFTINCKVSINQEVSDRVRFKLQSVNLNNLKIIVKFYKSQGYNEFRRQIQCSDFIDLFGSSVIYIDIKSNHDKIKKLRCETIIRDHGRSMDYQTRFYVRSYDANDRQIKIDDDQLFSEMKEFVTSTIQQEVIPVTSKLAKLNDAYKALNENRF